MNYDVQKNKHSLAAHILQNGIFSTTWHYTSNCLQITTWFISAPNINQPTFGIDQMKLYGQLQFFQKKSLHEAVGSFSTCFAPKWSRSVDITSLEFLVWWWISLQYSTSRNQFYFVYCVYSIGTVLPSVTKTSKWETYTWTISVIKIAAVVDQLKVLFIFQG